MSIHWPSIIDRFPSVVVEGVSGLILAGAAALAVHFAVSHALLVILALATAGSILYETQYDANGFSWLDVAQREAGIALGVILFAVLT